MGRITRALTIATVLCTHLVLHRLNRHRHKPLGMRMREAAERLGPTFIKFGQALSTRYELFSEADRKELRKLLDQVPPMDDETIDYLFRFDFGKLPEKMFEEFDRRPLASASIAQVHRAVLKDGTRVAVKIRRPFIGKPITQDIQLLRMLVGLAQLFSGTLRHIQAHRAVNEISTWLMQEIDFENEKENIEKFRDVYGARERVREDLGRLVIPDVYEEYCSFSILTMEFIEGTPVTRYEEVMDNPEYDVLQSLMTYGVSPLRKWLLDGYVLIHGDPHPSNILIMKGGDVGLIDFGLIGEITRPQTKYMADLMFAVYLQDLDGAIEHAIRMTGADHTFADRIRQDMKQYIEQAPEEGIGYWFFESVRIFIKHRAPAPLFLALFGRANITTDGMIEMVSPGTKVLDIMGEELKTCVKRRMASNFRETNYLPVLYKLSEKMKKSPTLLVRLIDRYCEDPLRFARDVGNALRD